MFKVGDKAIMNFYCAGMVSQEEYPVCAVDGDTITLETDDEIEKCFRFDAKTGKCLNDITEFGARRTLELSR